MRPKTRRYLCPRFVGASTVAPALVEVDTLHPDAPPRVTHFSGLEPHSTLYFPGTISYDGATHRLTFTPF